MLNAGAKALRKMGQAPSSLLDAASMACLQTPTSSSSPAGTATNLLKQLLHISSACQVHDAPLAPEKVKMVLEVGCSAGLWAKYCQERYQHAHIVRVDRTLALDDLRDFAGEQTIIPEDFLQTARPLSNFNLVRAYRRSGCISNWLDISRKAYDVLAPGGFFEICDASRIYDCLQSDWGTLSTLATGCMVDHPGLFLALKQAGFANLRQHKRQVMLDSLDQGADLATSIVDDAECAHLARGGDPGGFRALRDTLLFQAFHTPIMFTLLVSLGVL